jgi:diguanylate cyclase (GGDEF)-like protein
LQDTLVVPIVIEESDDSKNDGYQISASIGISIYPNDGLTTDELMECADKAMYIAKSSKKSNIQFSNLESVSIKQ